MKYVFTPDEAQTVAEIIKRFYKRRRYSVTIETPFNEEVRYCTTLKAMKTGLCVLVEVQGRPTYSRSFQELVRYLAAKRVNSKTYIATHRDAIMRSGLIEEIKADNVGLIIVDENGNANISIEAGNPALMVTPDPNLRFGEYRDQIHTIVNKFNSGSRKDALRDLCELGEHMTDKLINKALRKHYFKTTVTQANIDAMNWESTINTLGSHNQCISGTLPIFDSVLKTDMISFKNGRNLVDHQVRTARERRERELQFADRATLGLRLCSKLVSIIRRT